MAVAADELEVRAGSARTDDTVGRGIELERRDPGGDEGADRVEGGRGDQAGLDHRPQLRGRLVDGGAEGHEIGRASCREKSVSVRVDLGGRRIIKKKTVSLSINDTNNKSTK